MHERASWKGCAWIVIPGGSGSDLSALLWKGARAFDRPGGPFYGIDNTNS